MIDANVADFGDVAVDGGETLRHVDLKAEGGEAVRVSCTAKGAVCVSVNEGKASFNLSPAEAIRLVMVLTMGWQLTLGPVVVSIDGRPAGTV